ncbi:hypothetical protein GGI23_002640 [Coemansia sp. RSA 2559]|nr:hypothetical protein GGI23_002640 [Coemansia sp. RSA 2559]KAJ2858743.1 hypothetical protein GGI22_003264 [Coemansia erecta]
MQLLGKTRGALSLLGSTASRTQRHTPSQPRIAFSTGRIARDKQEAIKHGLVVGISGAQHTLYGAEATGLTAAQQQQIVRQIQALGNKAHAGSVQLVFLEDHDSGKHRHVAVVGLGDDAKHTGEIVRTAVANGVRQLCARGKITNVAVGPMPCYQASAEGAKLALYKFDAFKTKTNYKDSAKEESSDVTVTHLAQREPADASRKWDAGVVYAEAQNFARDLMNAPANHMTPTGFAERVKTEFSKLGNVKVNVYDKTWAEEQRMGGLLAVSRGSDEPLRFVEIIYTGKKGKSAGDDGVPLALVGKGITFDTGGYSLKPSKYMDLMKGDMGGGATVVAAMRAIAQLQLPIDVVATVPLCENMVSGGAVKVSDVYTSRAGLTVEVMNTDAEGRLVLADALHYTIEAHRPRAIVDVATLTGAMVVALGELYTGVFTPSPLLWATILQASASTDEPVWRMPLHDQWDAMLKSPVADLSNIGNKAEAGACTAAAFLRQFVGSGQPKPLADSSGVLRDQNNDESIPRWAHLDIAGPMEASASSGYHQKGLSGRPTRMLIELAQILANKPLP